MKWLATRSSEAQSSGSHDTRHVEQQRSHDIVGGVGLQGNGTDNLPSKARNGASNHFDGFGRDLRWLRGEVECNGRKSDSTARDGCCLMRFERPGNRSARQAFAGLFLMRSRDFEL